MVQSQSSTPSTNGASANADIENLPALLKELDGAHSVADGVEDKLDSLIAQIEALEKNLEQHLETAVGSSETTEGDQSLSDAPKTEDPKQQA